MKKLNKIYLIITTSLTFFGCNNEQKINLFEEVKKGNQLHVAKEISVSDFFQIWVRRGIPWKANIEITEVYKDEHDIYFYERLNLKNQHYLGNRKFEKGVAKIYKVSKAELEYNFAFYKDLDPTEIRGIDLRKAFAKKVGLKNEYDKTHLNGGIFEYILKPQQIIVSLIFNEKKYISSYEAAEKRFK